ncbi:ABC-type Fe3+-siderophore transport system, permease component [Caldisphaera lagunensis DSM 15908]|uniref:ABC-type Fe3+-siderophore transport system, permease component n=1 Tax=Caldisphaera lagunensis (strain DSM 15908 / JCM 11604 / ANMR 0165 / IC-154) TaxID=1056495 RepID=L0AA16_CALLD|nr:iron ABC transporter permease [Caldisphaera lagunensis]AFZ70743.1 ABC-type Fe3+-siderophore transport system, permease component [Caldisphaera lagunensis DSM 15908]
MKSINKILTVFLILLLPISFLLSLSIGPYSKVSIYQVIFFILGKNLPSTYIDILKYRLIRSLAALILGIGLSSSGLTLQYTLKNPLADPYLLGISSGAIFGVTIAMFFGYYSFYQLYIIALLSALLSLGFILLISTIFKSSSTTIIIAGISLSYLLNGITTIYMIRLGPKIPSILFWLFGSVAFTTLNTLEKSSILVIISLFFMFYYWKAINTLMLGEDVAKSLGVKVSYIRIVSVLFSSISTAALVAMAGPVGFIGLAAPWMARLIIGSNFGKALLMSLLTGSLLAIFSDILARLVIYPSEAPLTAITSIFGAPVLIYLTLKYKGRL